MSNVLYGGNRRREGAADLRDAELGWWPGEGDRGALGEYFARNRSWLRPTAKRIGGELIDGDDLLGEVLLSVIARVVDGSAWIDDIGPYLLQAMRNRVKDELRSPRSRVSGLEKVPEPCQDDSRAVHRIDIGRERGIVRSAFARLDEAEQRVLSGVAIDGLRPRHLAQELGRRPQEISDLVYRAKAKLRRAILQEVLSAESPGVECREVSAMLPSRLPGDLRQLRALEPMAAHLDRCASCGRAWERYTQISRLAA